MHSKQQKILITGGRGFFGSYVCQKLQHTSELIAVVRPGETPPPQTEAYEWDLLEKRPLHMKDQLRGIDAIIHLAQSAKYRQFPEQADELFQVNIAATEQLLEFAYQTGVKQFIFASTGSIYRAEESRQVSLTENAVVSPQGFYATSKLVSEHLIQTYGHYFKSKILRFFFLYGPKQKDKLIPNLVEKIIRNNAIQLQGTDGYTFQPLHVRDAAALVANVLNYPDALLLNVAGNTRITLRQTCEVLGQSLGIEPSFAADLMAKVTDWCVDTTRLQTLLNFHWQVSPVEGLREVVYFARPQFQDLCK